MVVRFLHICLYHPKQSKYWKPANTQADPAVDCDFKWNADIWKKQHYLVDSVLKFSSTDLKDQRETALELQHGT